MVSNMIRNENVPMNLYGTNSLQNSPDKNLSTSGVLPAIDDAFDDAIAKDIDALDAIACEGAEESLFVEDIQNKGMCS